MTVLRPVGVLSFVLALVLGLSLPLASAPRPEVRDEAGFFGADAVRQANRGIQDIRKRYGTDLLVETYAEPPADVAARLAREPRERVFGDWVHRRARELGLNGIYVLVTRNPAYLQVGVGSETRKAAFTSADRDRLRDVLLQAFREKRYDEGLVNAVDFTRRRLETTVGAGGGGAVAPAGAERERAAGRVGGASWTAIVFWGALLLLGLWGLSRYLRNRAAGAGARGYGVGPSPGAPGGPTYGPGTPGYGYGGPPPYGGGGFGRGLLGGLLGGMAGGYLYDRLRGRDAAEATPFGGRGEAGGDGGDIVSSGGGFDDAPQGGADVDDQPTDFGSGGDFGGGADDSAA